MKILKKATKYNRGKKKKELTEWLRTQTQKSENLLCEFRKVI
jgi:hypothetical protein